MPLDDTFARQLLLLNRLYKASNSIYRELAARFDLNDATFWILHIISSHSADPLTQSDLSTEWFIPLQTVHSAVQTLVKRGLLHLAGIPGTKNRKQILLTEEGRLFASKVVDRVDEIEKSAFMHLTPEERDTYLHLFKKHLAALRAEEQRVLDQYENQ